MFVHDDIPMSGAHAVLGRIKATIEILAGISPVHLVVDNTDVIGDNTALAEGWGLGHPGSQSLRRQAQ